MTSPIARTCRALVLLATAVVSSTSSYAAEPATLRVMTYNIWVGGESGGQPLSQTAKVIETARADVVGMQETRGERRNGRQPDRSREVAASLGWNHFDQGDGTAVLTRHKIVANTPRNWGVCFETADGRRAWIFNVHLAHAPYQPYQLLKIPYADAPFIDTEEAAIAAARAAREESISAMLGELQAIRDEGTPIFVTGDFNEPSPLDWTEAVFKAGRIPTPVKWPTAGAVLNSGFVDAFRVMRPDPLLAPGYTWTPITAPDDPKDHHDRIDLVLVGGKGAEVTQAEVVGESDDNADVVVEPYPSDHRAVVATVKLQ